MAGQFRLGKTETNQFNFILLNGKGETLFTSSSFSERSEAEAAISVFKSRAESFPNFERKKTPENEMFFVVRDPGGKVLGTSEKHTGIANLENSITDVNKHASEAVIIDQTILG